MMEHEAVQLASKLIVATTGWSDPATDGVIERMKYEWPDPQLGARAIEDVVGSWTRGSRPTWAVLNDAYKAAKRRYEMEHPTPALDSGDLDLPDYVPAPPNPRRIVSPAEGMQIAYRSYCNEVRHRGREPRSFDEFKGALVGKDRTMHRRARW